MNKGKWWKYYWNYFGRGLDKDFYSGNNEKCSYSGYIFKVEGICWWFSITVWEYEINLSDSNFLVCFQEVEDWKKKKEEEEGKGKKLSW